jgi:hypothetical protein
VARLHQNGREGALVLLEVQLLVQEEMSITNGGQPCLACQGSARYFFQFFTMDIPFA